MIEVKDAIERAIERIEGRDAAIERFVANHGESCFQAPCGQRDDQRLIAHPCTHPGHETKWQRSFFDDRGASGHVIAPYRRLIEELITHYNLGLSGVTRIEKPPQSQSRRAESPFFHG